MISNRTLWRASVYIAVGGMTCVMIMRSILKERVRQSQYFRDSLKILRLHEGAKFLLGDGIKEVGFDIGSPNFATNSEAHFQVNVKGQKNRGLLYLWAEKNSNSESWMVDKLELQLKDDDKRLVIKKSSHAQ